MMKKCLLYTILAAGMLALSLKAQPLQPTLLNFEGDDGRVEVPDHPSLDFAGSFTVELWFQPLMLDGWQRLIGKGTVNTAEANWSVSLMSDNTIDFFWESADDRDHLLSTTDTIRAGEFYHLAAVLDLEANEFRIYLNGNLSATATAQGDTPAVNDDPLYVGMRRTINGFEKAYAGYLDEVRLWQRARTRQQIRRTLNKALAPQYYQSADSGLVAYWQCDSLEDLGIGGDGVDDIRDLSIYGNHGDLAGDVTLTTVGAYTGIGQPGSLARPEGFVLWQNYPNPFNPKTVIRYQLSGISDTEVAVYNLLGQRIRLLMQGRQAAGAYELTWNGRDDVGREVSSGFYICELKAGGYRQAVRMLLLK